jgi:hypothetical protein
LIGKRFFLLLSEGDTLSDFNLFPFERNKYYPGKLLTSSDFLAEQNYLSGRSRLLNNLFYGSGIVLGLGVVNLDDTSIIVESGVAIDPSGRELVLDTSEVIKLPAIEGFSGVSGSEFLLCLGYKEEDVQPVYAMGSAASEGGTKMNRVREGAQLFVVSPEEFAQAHPKEDDSAFFATDTVYEDANYSLTIKMPKVIPNGYSFDAVVTLKKITDEDTEFAAQIEFGAPAFVSASGGRELKLSIPPVSLGAGESASFRARLTADLAGKEDTMLIFKADESEISIGGIKIGGLSGLMLGVTVTDMTPAQIAETQTAMQSLDERMASFTEGLVPLAFITCERERGRNVIIKSVKEEGVRSYIPVPSHMKRGAELTGAFVKNGESAAALAAGAADSSSRFSGEGFAAREPVYATGQCEIPIKTDNKAGEVFYSGDIVHGLGEGDVYVSVGFEYLDNDQKLGRTARHTIYGDPRLFKGTVLSLPEADLGVIVKVERGSFVVAARLKEATDYVLLPLRWVAMRLPSLSDAGILAEVSGEAFITPANPTLRMKPSESVFVDIRFTGMPRTTLTYELTDKKSGTITSDGIFTAANKEGVHEIHVFCTDHPQISTYVYAIVKRTGTEE